MSVEPEIPLPAEQPRYCPACGTRVAARAKTCLMCGASLEAAIEEKVAVEEAAPRERWRGWFWLSAFGLALGILLLLGVLMQPFLFPAASETPPGTPPTSTPQPSATGLPTNTPTATPTFTPIPPRAHLVQQDETLISIAALYDTTVDELLRLNPGITPELLQVNQVLLVPAATPTPAMTPTPDPHATPTPTPGDFIIHVVAPGETLLAIARQYSVTVSLIRAANPQIPPGSDLIQPNQPLIIPLGTPMPTATPTPDPNATPTPIPPYPAPFMISPPDGAVFGGADAVIVLQWTAVRVLGSGEWYELRIIPPEGEVIVERTRTTAYRLPSELFPTGRGRQFRWQVRVVRFVRQTGTYEPASLENRPLSFSWLEAPLTPTATPEP
jgi:LysM repeat protein